MQQQGNLLKKMGYAELYEFANPEENKLGRFVGFDNDNPGKICLFKPNSNNIIGVTTVNSVEISDYYTEWPNKFLCNEFGDTYMKHENLAVGIKQYDEVNERPFIMTAKSYKYVPLLNEKYDPSKEYVQRLGRPEWNRVTLCGKAIVIDNGKCTPGKMCMPYNGKDENLFGTAIPATAKAKYSYYVIERFSEKSIIILVK